MRLNGVWSHSNWGRTIPTARVDPIPGNTHRESDVQARIDELLGDLGVTIEASNQARVHTSVNRTASFAALVRALTVSLFQQPVSVFDPVKCMHPTALHLYMTVYCR
jgi:hypothetical protein